MNAMILAAGKGTRLMPLTQVRPKCLMPVMNRPLLGLWLGRLNAMGLSRVIVNTHHLSEKVNKWLTRFPPATMEVLKSHEPQILGTGGGLVKARTMLGPEPFLLVNADVIYASDLAPLAAEQAHSGAMAVLGLVDEPKINTVAVGGEGQILGFASDQEEISPARWRTYSGLAAISPELLSFLPASGYSTLVDGIKAALAQGALIKGFELTGFWSDLGEPQGLLDLHRRLINEPPPELAHLAPGEPRVVANEARIDNQAQVKGFAVLGREAVIRPGAEVEDVILYPKAEVLPGAKVKNAILGDGFLARGDLSGGAYA
ncbi:MAG: sugar phosphate nucleotidyltransferase [Desulfarculaceae bacterium]|jgi:NDP-sugar pyrophosphorylase family protein